MTANKYLSNNYICRFPKRITVIALLLLLTSLAIKAQTTTVTLTLNLDQYPAETSWTLTNESSGDIIASANLGDYSTPFDVITEVFELTEGSYIFTIFDGFGDGLSIGNGSYQLEALGVILASGGGNFGKEESSTFNLFDPMIFATTWQTTTASESITIPTQSDVYAYNYTIDWGDGQRDSLQAGNASHTYENPGSYLVSIIGDFPAIYFNQTGDTAKIKSITQWGAIAWASMNNAFAGCSQLINNAADSPDISTVTDMSSMFYKATSFNGDLSSWNVSSVTNMDSMFYKATSFNGGLSNWNVSNVTDMSSIFYGATSFNEDLSGWDVSSVTDMSSMFYGTTSFNGGLSSWDVSSVTDMSSMFHKATSFNGDLSSWDVSNVSDMSGMFFEAASFNSDLSGWDISKVLDMADMLTNCDLSLINYDALLINWAALPDLQRGVTLGKGPYYCHGVNARKSLIDAYSWNIVDQGQQCTNELFITNWLTTANNESITIPTQSDNYGYNYNINWGDGTYDSLQTGNSSHTYTAPGVYTVAITGEFPAIYFNNSGDAAKIQTIEQWGTIAWASMNNAFAGCEKLVHHATDTPDLSALTDMSRMFYRAASFNSDISDWDISNVTDMTDMLVGSGLSIVNYDVLLIGWSQLPSVQSGVRLNVEPAYCNGINARQFLIDHYNWRIDDKGQQCTVEPFITTWEVTAPNESITIPTNAAGYPYMYNIDWGDGQSSKEQRDNSTHQYANPGIYTVSITGVFPAIYFNNSGDTANIQTIEQWGTINWSSMSNAFEGCSNLTYHAIDAPNLSEVTTVNSMFSGVTSFDGDIGGWNMSHITDANGMLSNSGLSEANYDNTLIGWANQTVNKGVSLGANGLKYCRAASARVTLETNGWVINGDAPTLQVIDKQPISKAVESGTDVTFSVTTTDPGLFYQWQKDGVHIGINSPILTINNCSAADEGEYEVIISDGGECSAVSDKVTLEILPSNALHFSWGNKLKVDNALSLVSNSPITIEGWVYATKNAYQSLFGFRNEAENDFYLLILGGTNSTDTVNVEARFRNSTGDKTDLLTSINFNQWTHLALVYDGSSTLALYKNGLLVESKPASGDLQGDTPFGMGSSDVFDFFLQDGMLDEVRVWNEARSPSEIYANMMSPIFPSPDSLQLYYTMNQGVAGGDNTRIDSLINRGSASGYNASLRVGEETLPSIPPFPFLRQGLTSNFIEQTTPISTKPFITKWQTESENDTITIPTSTNSYPYNYFVDWGDSTISHEYGDASHIYNTAGLHTIKIVGFFPAIIFNNKGSKEHIIDISQWGSIPWKRMDNSFDGCFNLNISATDAPDLSKVFSMAHMFNNATAFNSDLNSWDVSNITDMRAMFSGASSFNGDISAWNVSNVKNISKMFNSAASFNRNLNNWDVSSVENMSETFSGATSFNGDVSTWDVSSVRDMSRMFSNAASFNRDLIMWDISSIENISSIFSGATAFNGDISTWDVSKITNTEFMFASTEAFNQDISGWDVSNVTNMQFMFISATAFDQDLSSWDVSKVKDMGNMLTNSGLSSHNYSRLLNGWASLPSLQNGVTLSTGPAYCGGEQARQSIIDKYQWRILDNGNGKIPPIVENPIHIICAGEEMPSIAAEGRGNARFDWYNEQDDIISSSSILKPSDDTSVAETTHFTYYVTQTVDGCRSDSTEAMVTVHPTPIMGFSYSEERCEGTELTFTDTLNSDTRRRRWRFGDRNSAISETSLQTHTFNEAGIYDISLTVTELGCMDSLEKTITIGEAPKANFNWANICQGNATQFIDATTTGAFTKAAAWAWDFGDGQTTNSNTSSVQHLYEQYGTKQVTLTVISETGCMDDTTQMVSILPMVTGTYQEDFNDSLQQAHGWFASGDPTTSWETGIAAGNAITPKDGASWITNANGFYLPNEKSHVYSPCFDLSALERPMVKLDIWSDLASSDGVVIGVSTDGGDNWEVLGNLNDGINWYNQQGLDGNPGNQSTNQYGWTGTYEGWKEVRRDLSIYKDSASIRFRVSLGASSNIPDKDGFAFDNFSIVEQDRVVLLEYFTNIGSPRYEEDKERILHFADTLPSDVLTMHYHTDFPFANDPVNILNTNVSSVRALYYGISETSKAVLNGGFYPKNPNSITYNDIDTLALQTASFKFNFDMSGTNEAQLALNLAITSLKNIETDDPLTLRVAMVNKVLDIDGVSYQHIISRLIPDAAGLDLPSDWDEGEVLNQSLTWQALQTRDLANVRIIAFIQNDITREVLQAAYYDPNKLPVVMDLDELEEGLANISLYPNPVENTLNAVFGQAVSTGYKWQLRDVLGREITPPINIKSRKGFTVDVSQYPKGLYLLHLIKQGDIIITKKIIVK